MPHSTPNIQSSPKTIKVVIIGDSGVGKTNLLTTFCQGSFRDSYVATIGVDFKIKMIDVEGKKVKLQIWDTAGQQRYRTIAQTYYKGAAGIILTYAINSASSFRNINSWLKQIDSHASQNVCKMLVGTKNDLKQQREVTEQEGRALAIKFGLQFSEVSAKTNENVGQTFKKMAYLIQEERQSTLQSRGSIASPIRLESKNEKQKNCAC